MTSFVVVYNRRTGDVAVTPFHGPHGNRDAIRKRLAVERDRTNSDVEVVSLVGDSLEAVKKTHSRYFRDEFVDA